MVRPVPPFGLFHTGSPSHCAATGPAAQAIMPTTKNARFICDLKVNCSRAVCEGSSHPGNVDLQAPPDAEPAVGRAIAELLGIIRDMNPEGTNPGVAPPPPPEVGLVLARPRRRVPVPVV